ncbi:hypothetical protein [Thioclava sp. JE_KL1]|uniref:hypothetical protein n=1 Tax=Thioclava sp. JE_KL1 TaxID=2651187 RepID=UPI00128D4618|nr:hypothetical protein [Thioclava sp. JE_KL1]MPQ95211.1 hypothetical protein [Thioclava sp. JE_KL1]
MSYKLSITATAVCFALAGCMGSGDGSNSFSAAEVSQNQATYDSLATRVTDGDLLVAQDPTGSASLTGQLKLDPASASDNPVAGRLAMDVDFDNSKVTGTVSQFAAYTPDLSEKMMDLKGSLSVNGTIDSKSAIVANANGTVSDDEGSITADLQLAGSVYDDNGKYVALGDVTGTGVSPDGSEQLTGTFYAQQQ